MLVVALGWAEVLGAADIFCGVNAVDYSGYPDCRPEFIEAFERLANLATKAGVEGTNLRMHAPLMQHGQGRYRARRRPPGRRFRRHGLVLPRRCRGRACGHCDACRLRAQGFADAGVADPTCYR